MHHPTVYVSRLTTPGSVDSIRICDTSNDFGEGSENPESFWPSVLLGSVSSGVTRFVMASVTVLTGAEDGGQGTAVGTGRMLQVKLTVWFEVYNINIFNMFRLYKKIFSHKLFLL